MRGRTLLVGLLAVHLVLFLWFSVNVERRVSPDSMNYISVARNAVAGDGFVQSAPGFNQPTFWGEDFTAEAPLKTRAAHNVGYSLLVAGAAWITGLEASDSAFALSALAYGLAIVSGFVFARRLWNAEAGLLAAGALSLVLRREFLYARTEALSIALLLALLALLAGPATLRRTGVAGLVTGVVLLVRGEAMAVVALMGVVACLMATEDRPRRLLIYGAGVILPLPGAFVGDGHVYPPVLSSQSARFPEASVGQLSSAFGQATTATFALLALFALLAWQRSRRDGAPLWRPDGRTGMVLAAVWIGGYSALLFAARMVVFTEEFSSRLLRPLVAVVALCCAGLFWRLLAPRWRSWVAVTAFTGSMLVNIGYNATLAATGYDRGAAARVAESARRSWIAANSRPDDFVIGQQVQELPYFLTSSPAVASFSDAPFFPHVTREKVDALFRARCETHRDLYLLLRLPEPGETVEDELVRSGAFIAPLVYGNPAVDYRLAADLADGRIYRYTGCTRGTGR